MSTAGDGIGSYRRAVERNHQKQKTLASRKRWRAEEIADGIVQCMTNDWTEDGPNQSVKLTDAGFAEV